MLGEHVDEAAGRRDDNVGAAPQHVVLLAHVDAANA